MFSLAERQKTQRRIEELSENRLEGFTPDYEGLKAVHKYIFQDAYEWAGKSRAEEVTIQGDTFTPELMDTWTRRGKDGEITAFFQGSKELEVEAPIQINRHAQIFDRAESQGTLDVPKFSELAADMVEDMNFAHAFADGNGRAMRGFLVQLGRSRGINIDLDAHSKEHWISASILSSEAMPQTMISLIENSASIMTTEQKISWEKSSVKVEPAIRLEEQQGLYKTIKSAFGLGEEKQNNVGAEEEALESSAVLELETPTKAIDIKLVEDLVIKKLQNPNFELNKADMALWREGFDSLSEDMSDLALWEPEIKEAIEDYEMLKGVDGNTDYLLPLTDPEHPEHLAELPEYTIEEEQQFAQNIKDAGDRVERLKAGLEKDLNRQVKKLDIQRQATPTTKQKIGQDILESYNAVINKGAPIESLRETMIEGYKSALDNSIEDFAFYGPNAPKELGAASALNPYLTSELMTAQAAVDKIDRVQGALRSDKPKNITTDQMQDLKSSAQNNVYGQAFLAAAARISPTFMRFYAQTQALTQFLVPTTVTAAKISNEQIDAAMKGPEMDRKTASLKEKIEAIYKNPEQAFNKAVELATNPDISRPPRAHSLM